jgi:hypothetical protein
MFEFFSQLMGGGAAASTTIGPGAMSHMSPDQWGTTVQNPSGGGGIAGLLADPNILTLMAGVGANLDPDGVGGAVGKPVQGMIQNKQMGKAMEKQDQRWSSLIEAMAGGKVGSASIKEDGKGGTSVSLKAPEGLGALSEGMQNTAPQEPASPFQSYVNNMQGWFAKYANGGM